MQRRRERRGYGTAGELRGRLPASRIVGKRPTVRAHGVPWDCSRAVPRAAWRPDELLSQWASQAARLYPAIEPVD